MTLVRRSDVPSRARHGDYRQELRTDFGASCAYCSISEAEAQALAFEIDHYLPEERFPLLSAEYFNLMYSCDACNNYKSDHYPSDAQLDECRRIFRPDWDRRFDHFRLIANDQIEGKTTVGEHTIELLMLRRTALQKLRQLRRRIFEAEALVEGGVAALNGLSLDEVRRDVRFQFKALLPQLNRDADAQKLLAETLSQARSFFRDEDPQRRRNLKVRRDYIARYPSAKSKPKA